MIVFLLLVIMYGSEGMECSVCSDPLEQSNTREYYQTTCSHQFHRTCLSDWFQRQKNCPLCRKNLPKDYDAFLCEPGYTYIPQHLTKAHQHITPVTCSECAAACEMDYSCTSYECSPTQQICNLYDHNAPAKQKRGHPKMEGFHLCQRNESERSIMTMATSQRYAGKSWPRATFQAVLYTLLYQGNAMYHTNIYRHVKNITSDLKKVTFSFLDCVLWLIYGSSMLMLWFSKVPASPHPIGDGIYVEIFSIYLTLHLILRHLGRFNIWFVNIMEGFIFAWIQRWLFHGFGFHKHTISVFRKNEYGRELSLERSLPSALFMQSFWKKHSKEELILALSVVSIAHQLAHYINNTYFPTGMHICRKKLINQRLDRTWLTVHFVFGTIVSVLFELVFTATGWLGVVVNQTPREIWMILWSGLKLKTTRFSNLSWEVLFGYWYFHLQYGSIPTEWRTYNIPSYFPKLAILIHVVSAYLSQFNLSIIPGLLIGAVVVLLYLWGIVGPV